jgi:hypothetical protein
MLAIVQQESDEPAAVTPVTFATLLEALER